MGAWPARISFPNRWLGNAQEIIRVRATEGWLLAEEGKPKEKNLVKDFTIRQFGPHISTKRLF